jgi:hypothetical protein
MQAQHVLEKEASKHPFVGVVNGHTRSNLVDLLRPCSPRPSMWSIPQLIESCHIEAMTTPVFVFG